MVLASPRFLLDADVVPNEKAGRELAGKAAARLKASNPIAKGLDHGNELRPGRPLAKGIELADGLEQADLVLRALVLFNDEERYTDDAHVGVNQVCDQRMGVRAYAQCDFDENKLE